MKKMQFAIPFLLLILPGTVGAQRKVPLTVPYSGTSANFLCLWVAKEARHFDDEDLDTRLLQVRGGSLTVQLLVSGESAIATVGATAIAHAYLQGMKDLVMVAAVTNVMSYVLVSRPEIRGPESMKGKKVAVSRFGSTADFVAEYALKHLGLKKTDVSMVQMGSEMDRLALMQRGGVDMGVFTSNSIPALKKAGLHTLVDLQELKIPYLLNGVATTRSFLAKDRPLAVKFMRALIKGIKTVKSDRPLAQRVLAKYLKISDPELLKIAAEEQVKLLPDPPFPTEGGIRTILEDLGRNISDANRISPTALMDPTIVSDAAKGQ
ncbi:MAG: ABC transporter substrate-binding protein [Deltaproteobacteria bacterium]|nr:ABC transporter substrate-binding protein [Deltaproteobacteria bacterium]